MSCLNLEEEEEEEESLAQLFVETSKKERVRREMLTQLNYSGQTL